MKGYGSINKHLTEILKKGAFKWSPKATGTFQQLKKAMSIAPVLRMSDFSKTIVVEIDASSKGIGAILMQEGQLIAFLRRALGPRSLGYSIYKKELMVVVMVVTK